MKKQPCLDKNCICRHADARGYVHPTPPPSQHNAIGIFAPRDMKFELRRRPDGTADFFYEEHEPDHLQAMKNTYLMLKQALAKDGKIKIKMVGRGRVRVYGKAIPFKTVADMLASEFFQWSSLGDVTVRELWMSKMMMAIAAPTIEKRWRQAGVMGESKEKIAALVKGKRGLTMV